MESPSWRGALKAPGGGGVFFSCYNNVLGFILCIANIKKDARDEYMNGVQRQQKGDFLTYGGYTFHSLHSMKYELWDILDKTLLVPQLKYRSLGSFTETIITYTVKKVIQL